MPTSTIDASYNNIKLYQEIQTQNTTLSNAINNMKEQYSTDTNRKLYKTHSHDYIKNISDIIYYIYYSVFVIFAFFLFYSKKLKLYFKIIIIAIFLVYPYFMYLIENFIYQMTAYVASKA
jgi:hypothetical protein